MQSIVSANRCTDKTVEIVSAMGREICENAVKCISAVINDGAKLAGGDIIVTIDADSRMTEEALLEFKEKWQQTSFLLTWVW